MPLARRLAFNNMITHTVYNFSVPQRSSCPSNKKQVNIERTFHFSRCFFLLMYTIFLKSLLNLLEYCFRFMFWFFGHEAWKILAPQRGIEPSPPALEGDVLTTGPPRKSLEGIFKGILKPMSDTKVLPGYTLWGSHLPLISLKRLGIRSIFHLETNDNKFSKLMFREDI